MSGVLVSVEVSPQSDELMNELPRSAMQCRPVHTHTQTHTHTCLMAHCPGLSGWASNRKVKTIQILLKQETVSGSGISWDICKSAPRSRQITMPAPHHSVFLQARCPSCHQTNSVKTLQALFIRICTHITYIHRCTELQEMLLFILKCFCHQF